MLKVLSNKWSVSKETNICKASGSHSSVGEDRRPPELDPEREGISVPTEPVEPLDLQHSVTSDKTRIFSKHLAFFWVFCLFLTTWQT
jgi:hypothetical protein